MSGTNTEPGPLIQNFSVPAQDGIDVDFDIGPDASGTSLDGTTIYWRAFEQAHGVPTAGVAPVIEKVSTDSDQLVILDPDKMIVVVKILGDDTVNLLGNYYHEMRIVDSLENFITVARGIMTVTGTEIRL